MKVHVEANAKELGIVAGNNAADLIRQAIAVQGSANIILATGTSQFETLKQLIKADGIQWDKVVMFHLDEYINIPVSHKASFRKYLKELFLDKLPPLKAAYLINGETDPKEECDRLNKLISAHPVDVALIGIGENSHLAFNDPPADFDTTAPYIIINELDEDCRKQQLGEGWFPTLADVPRQALSMTIKQLMKAEHILCIVPDARKAKAIRACFGGDVSAMAPASILQRHPNAIIFLDQESSALLPQARAEAHAN